MKASGTFGVKNAVRARDGHKCVECGITNKKHLRIRGRSLHVHRQIPGSPYTVEGCITLCHWCHCRRHGSKRRGRWKPVPSNRLMAKVDAELAERLESLVGAFNAQHNLETDKSAHIVRAIREYCERLASEVKD